MSIKIKWNISFVLLIVALFMALYISANVVFKGVFWMDDQLARLLEHVPNSMYPFFIQLTKMGDKKVIGLVALVFLAWLLIKKRNYLGAAIFTLALSLGNELSHFLKVQIARPRPSVEHLVSVKSFSFPSGHALVGLILYFFIAYLLIQELKSKTGKIITAIIFSLLVLLIGASRIILQVHFPSDVIGGFAIGYIWLYFWLLFYQFLQTRYTKSKKADR